MNSRNDLTWHLGCIAREDRAAQLGQLGQKIWLTGLSASGRSTLSFALEHDLLRRRQPCYVLDGCNLPHHISSACDSPESPALELDTSALRVRACVERMVRLLGLS